MATSKKKSGSLILILVLIVIIGIVLVYVALSGGLGLGRAGSTPTPNVDMVDIVVASQSITRGTLITADVLTTIKYPQVNVPDQDFFIRLGGVDHVPLQIIQFDLSGENAGEISRVFTSRPVLDE